MCIVQCTLTEIFYTLMQRCCYYMMIWQFGTTEEKTARKETPVMGINPARVDDINSNRH